MFWNKGIGFGSILLYASNVVQSKFLLNFIFIYLLIFLVLIGYSTSNGIYDIIWIMRHQKEYATSFQNMAYIPQYFFDPKLQIGTPLKFFHLQHISIQSISHISTKIFHIFISNIWFINHTHFKC